MSRKRVPLNQNECTADFRIGVPFEQNLQEKRKIIDKYVTEVSERWILYAESLYQAGMQKILELLNL